MMTTTTYAVKGMTCDHCKQAVSTEVAKVAGVTGVEIDVPSGRVDITHEGPLDDAEVRAAVDEAGYEVAS